MTRRELWELIGRVGVGKDVNGIISFFLPNSAYIIKKKLQELNKPQTRLLLKNPGSTFLQIVPFINLYKNVSKTKLYTPIKEDQ